MLSNFKLKSSKKRHNKQSYSELVNVQMSKCLIIQLPEKNRSTTRTSPSTVESA